MIREIEELADSDDPYFFRKHVYTFMQNILKLQSSLIDAIEGMHYQTASDILHTMGGSAASIGGQLLAKLCLDLEKEVANISKTELMIRSRCIYDETNALYEFLIEKTRECERNHAG